MNDILNALEHLKQTMLAAGMSGQALISLQSPDFDIAKDKALKIFDANSNVYSYPHTRLGEVLAVNGFVLQRNGSADGTERF